MASLAEALEASTQRCLAMDAPLGERLQAFADDVRALSPEFAAIVERMVVRLGDSGAGSAAPAPGEEMSPFLLPDASGRLVSLAEILERGPAVVSFHRGHWCPYCRISAEALARVAPEVAAAGGQIVAITPELARFSAELAGVEGPRFPILTDMDGAYALALGLLIYVGEEKREAMKAAGFDITPFQGNDSWTLPIPATFVVGRDGRIEARFVDPDYRKRMAVEDMLAAVRRAG